MEDKPKQQPSLSIPIAQFFSYRENETDPRKTLTINIWKGRFVLEIAQNAQNVFFKQTLMFYIDSSASMFGMFFDNLVKQRIHEYKSGGEGAYSEFEFKFHSPYYSRDSINMETNGSLVVKTTKVHDSNRVTFLISNNKGSAEFVFYSPMSHKLINSIEEKNKKKIGLTIDPHDCTFYHFGKLIHELPLTSIVYNGLQQLCRVFMRKNDNSGENMKKIANSYNDNIEQQTTIL